MTNSIDNCDVVGCTERPIGSYLHASMARAVEFQVCDAHFVDLQVGKRPEPVAARLDLADLDGHPALLLE